MHPLRLRFVTELCWLRGWALAVLALSALCRVAVIPLGHVVLQPLFALNQYVHPLQGGRDGADLAAHGPRVALGMYDVAVCALILWLPLVWCRARQHEHFFPVRRLVVILCSLILIVLGVMLLLSVFCPVGFASIHSHLPLCLCQQ